MRKITEDTIIRPVYEALFKMIPNTVDSLIEVSGISKNIIPGNTIDGMETCVKIMMKFMVCVEDESSKISYALDNIPKREIVAHGKWYFINKQLKKSCEDISKVIIETSLKTFFNHNTVMSNHNHGIDDGLEYEYLHDSEHFKEFQPLLEYAAIHFYTSISLKDRDKNLTIDDVYKILQKKYNKRVKHDPLIGKDYEHDIINGDFVLTEYNANLLWNIVNNGYELASEYYDAFNGDRFFEEVIEAEQMLHLYEKERDNIAEYIKENKVKSE
jgi:hypothetical protein